MEIETGGVAELAAELALEDWPDFPESALSPEAPGPDFIRPLVDLAGTSEEITIDPGGTTAFTAPFDLPGFGVPVAGGRSAWAPQLTLAIAIEVGDPSLWAPFAAPTITVEPFLFLRLSDRGTRVAGGSLAAPAGAHLVRLPMPPGGGIVCELVAGATGPGDTARVRYRATVIAEPAWWPRETARGGLDRG